MNFIDKLSNRLDSNVYARNNPNEVYEAFKRLNVKVSKEVETFYEHFAGPFWEESMGMELLDIVDDSVNIESMTEQCRTIYLFPTSFLVLTEMVADEIIVLDTNDDKVYRVDFEYDGNIYPGTFERRNQDETEITHFLFTLCFE